jgi:hypothetical protein
MWVDGPNRLADEVDPRVRSFVGMMRRRALELQAPVWEEVEEELLVPDVGNRYAEVRVPTLVLVGSEDVSDIHEIAVSMLVLPSVRTPTGTSPVRPRVVRTGGRSDHDPGPDCGLGFLRVPEWLPERQLPRRHFQ